MIAERRTEQEDRCSCC